MRRISTFLVFVITVFSFYPSFSQGTPPGWGYQTTLNSHVISVPVATLINGQMIQPGDYIGVFYLDDDGQEACGGYTVYSGVAPVAIMAYGDDNMTTWKDGFASQEPFIFRIYSWCAEIEYTGLTAVAQSGQFSSLVFVPDGMTILQTLFGTGPLTHVISGTVSDASSPLAGVEISFTNSVNSVFTDNAGYYQRCVADGWSGDIIPLSTDFIFDPVAITLNNVTADVPDNDFVSVNAPVFISGNISDAGTNPVEGVSITFSGSTITTFTDASGDYQAALPYEYSGTATPSFPGYTFTPADRSYTDLTFHQENQNYVAEEVHFTLSGTITESGQPLEGVMVQFSNGGGFAITDAQGNYSQLLPYGWLGSATPVLAGKHFSPQYRSYTPLTSNITAQNYFASAALFTLSGTVTDNQSNPLTEVEILVSGYSSVFTTTAGAYSVQVAYGYTGTLQPVQPGYTFTPGIRNVVNVTSDLANLNFTGEAEQLVISGTITDNEGAPLSAVNLTFSNGGGTAATNATGAYAQPVNYGYSGVVIPSLLGYSFSPVNRSYSSLTSGRTDQNYTGTAQQVTIAGYITDTETGNPIPDVLVFFNNGGGTDTTNNEGWYSFSLPYGWSGTAYPDKENYTFTPASRNYNHVVNNTTGQNYSGTPTYIPPGWNLIPTDLTHNISIPLFSFPSINGSQIAIGDYIGVFYYDQTTQTERCGGYVKWTGQTALTAYGNDVSTPQKDGFTEGEKFRWRIHKYQTAVDYEAIAIYHAINPYSFDGKYHTNALSQLIGLNANTLTVSIWPETSEVCLGNSVILSASTQGGSGLYNFSWTSDPPGFSSTQTQIIVAPADTTHYECTVTTYLNSVTDQATVNIINPPVAPEGIVSDRDNFCADDNGTITLTAVGGSGEGIRWFSSGTEIGSDNPLTIESPHTTTIYCALWENSCGQSSCTEITVHVLPLPVAPVSVSSSDDEVCINDPGTLYLMANGGSGDILNWYANDVYIGSGSPFTVDSPEITTVYCAQWENSCGTSSCESLTVSVLPLPEPPETVFASSAEVCADDPGVITLTAQGGSGDVVKWFHNGSYFASGTSVIILSPEETSTYCARWENTCDVSPCVPVTVTVLPLPEPPEQVVSTTSAVCVNDPSTITLTAIGGSGDQVHWYGNSVWLGSGTALTVDSPEVTTTYCARWENSCGESSCAAFTVEVLPLPEAPDEVFVSDSAVCINDPGSITLTAQGGSGEVLSWYAGTALIGTGSPLIVESPEVPVTYCAQWENSCGVSECVTVSVTIIPLPEPPVLVSATPSEVCANATGSIVLFASGGSDDPIHWYAEGVWIGAGETLSVESPGITTTYCASRENECATSSCVETMVSVLALPASPDTILADRNGFCPQDTGTVTLTAVGGSGATLWWFEGNCGTDSIGSGNPLIIPSPGVSTTYYAAWESVCGMSDCAPVTLYLSDTCQNVHGITINDGWSGISSWIAPDDTLMENLMAPIIDDLVIVKDLVGAYWPPYANSIPYWETKKGYKIKVENPVTLTITGVAAEDVTIPLDQGWSLIPVLSPYPVSAADVFEPLGDNLIIVKTVASPEVYWPAASFYSLQYLMPGNAYMVAVYDPDTVTFAVTRVKGTLADPTVRPINPWNIVTPTGNTHVVALSKKALEEFASGDLIGVFNSENRCVGVVEVAPVTEYLPITVYGDDATTFGLDGMIENEPFLFKVWTQITHKSDPLLVEYSSDFPTREHYVTNGLSAVMDFTKAIGIADSPEIPVTLYPVPTREKLYVTVGRNIGYTVEIYTLTGQLLIRKEECAGTTELLTGALHPGVCTIRINTSSGTVVKRFVVVQ